GRPVRFGELELAGFVLPAVAGDLYTGDKGAFASPDVSGNLGGGVLRRFTVAFDYAGKRMYLAPNEAFGEADAFDRSGLWLMVDADGVRIADVAPRSAAQEAQLAIDDRIATIDGEPVAPRSLVAWRERLREAPAGTKLRLGLRRGGKNIEVDLVLADRIPARSPIKR
ncbi:MAG: PDZ domain-containing protein, partial [Xanthomonadales bacterium]|nr:PDZ domain-containing protein [Xanthomonadales bacterium]